MPLRSTIALCLLLMSLPIWAARTLDLYTADAILATDARQSEQDAAVTDAMRQVLVRVTGRADINAEPAIQSALEKASSYLSTFRFERSDITLTNVLGESVPAKRMIMKFDQGAIQELLGRNRLPVWGAKRPETLIWLADRLDGSDHILADSEGSEFARALVEQSRVRGVPMILPIMDLTDTLNVSFTDVYGLFTADLGEASERYQPDAILVGRVSRNEDGYQADFVYLLQNDRQRYQVSAADKAGLAAQLIDQIALRLSDQYAVVMDPAMAGQVSLRINNVRGLDTLAAVENYLGSLNLITRTTLRQVRPAVVYFDLEISGDRTQLRDMLALDNRLKALPETGLGTQLDNELVYQWVAP